MTKPQPSLTIAEHLARIDAARAAGATWRPSRVHPAVFLLSGVALGAGGLLALLLALGARF